MGIASKLKPEAAATGGGGGLFGQSQQQQQYGQPQQFAQQQYGQPQQYGQYGQAIPGQSPAFGQPQQPTYPGINYSSGPGAQFGQPAQPQYGQPQFAQPPSQYGQQPQSQSFTQEPGQFGQQQGGSYGAPSAQAAGAFDAGTLRIKLEKMVAENRLQHFYPPPRLEQLSQQLSRQDVAGLGRKWRLPKEINLDLVTLALYDIIVWADDSTSMQALDNGERIEDLKAILGRVADAATLFDDDGISVRFFNSPVQGDHLKSPAEINALLSRVRWEGYTPLGSGLEAKCIIPFVITPARNNFLKKPVLIITITDGEPTGPGEQLGTTRNVILRAKEYLGTLPYGGNAVSFMFAQVGKDQNAAAFLGALDKDPQVGRMIDCVSDYELEQEEYKRKGIDLTPDVYMVKLMVGSIDRSYDEGDEG